MWSQIVGLLTSLINVFYELTHKMGFPNYGLAIILFTVVLRILMFPLNLSQAKSTRAISLLQPQIKRLQQQYKNDQSIQNREMQALYRKYKVNPLSGCLPLLIQMPILFALFSALRNFDYTGEGTSFFWMKSMTDPDPTIIMPIIVGFSSFLQSKMSIDSQPNQSNEQTKMMNTVMLYGMPVMMGFMTRNFASGLAIYWSTFNILGFLMQIAINASVNRSQEGMKEAIEAEEKKTKEENAKEDERRRRQRDEDMRKTEERKRASAEKRKAQGNRNRNRKNDEDKGKELDFDDFS